MIDAKQFNLLPCVEKKSWLSAKRALIIIVAYLLLLLLATGFLSMSERASNKAVQNTQQAVEHITKQLQQYIGDKRHLSAVLPGPMVLDAEGFYKEFNALSELDVPDLWLTQVVIDRSNRFIKITGEMTSSDQLNQLLDFLSRNKIFHHYHFKGIEVSEEFLPHIPRSKIKQASDLQVPQIYHFVVQTTEIKKNSKWRGH